MKHLLFFIFTLTCITANAQNEVPQREPFTLKIAVDKEQFYEINIDKSPYFVHDKILQIYPGESLFIETEIKADTIAAMRVVREIKFPERTITVTFKQETGENGIGHERMQLDVKNPFDRYLNYSAAMYIVGHDDWIDTSIIPVFPKILGMEMWNDVIISLVLHDWRLEAPK